MSQELIFSQSLRPIRDHCAVGRTGNRVFQPVIFGVKDSGYKIAVFTWRADVDAQAVYFSERGFRCIEIPNIIFIFYDEQQITRQVSLLYAQARPIRQTFGYLYFFALPGRQAGQWSPSQLPLHSDRHSSENTNVSHQTDGLGSA